MGEAPVKKLGVGKKMPHDSMFKVANTRCRMYIKEGIIDIDDEELCHQVVAVFPCEAPGCPETFSSLLQFEMHYNTRHRFNCGQCRKRLPSAHFLDIHLSESHDSFFAAQAERKPMFRCFVEECPVVSQDVAQRRNHCIEAHSFPPNFRYDQSLKKNKKANQPENASFNTKDSEPMVVDEVQQKNPQEKKQFTFGQGKQGKSFSRNKPAQGSKSKCKNKTSIDEISTVELMDTLPS